MFVILLLHGWLLGSRIFPFTFTTSDDYEHLDWGSSPDNESFWAPPYSVSLPRGGACGGPGGPPPAPVGPMAPGSPAAHGGPPPVPVGPTACGGPPPPPSLGPQLDAPIPLPVDRFTLPPIKSEDDYLRYCNLILFWLCTPGFSTARDDSVLVTDGHNSLASQYWEGQLRTSPKDGDVYSTSRMLIPPFIERGLRCFRCWRITSILCPSPTPSLPFLPSLTPLRGTKRGFMTSAHALRAMWLPYVNPWLPSPHSSGHALPLCATFLLQ